MLGFVVILQISWQICSVGTKIAFCWNLGELPACFSTFGLVLKFEMFFFCMNSSTRILGLKQMICPQLPIATNNMRKIYFLKNTLPLCPINFLHEKILFMSSQSSLIISQSKWSIANITLNTKQHFGIFNYQIRINPIIVFQLCKTDSMEMTSDEWTFGWRANLPLSLTSENRQGEPREMYLVCPWPVFSSSWILTLLMSCNLLLTRISKTVWRYRGLTIEC